MRERHEAVIEFMRNRRSVPANSMTGPGPDEVEIREMIRIASHVPDHGKLAPWRFINYTLAYRAQLGEKFAARAVERDPKLSEQMQRQERERFTRAPVVIAVASRAAPHPKVPQWEQLMSAGAAAMSLLIAANAYGWDAQWLTEWVAFDDALATSLGLQNNEKIAGFIYIGKRTLPKTERDRPAVDDIFTTLGD
jgi:nitroreductase